MTSGNLHPKEVCGIIDNLEISPSHDSPGDLANAAKNTKTAPSGKSGAGGEKESGFMKGPNETKGPRR